MIQKIRKDHLLHFIAGNYTVLATMIFTTDIVVIIAVLLAVAIGKELIYDKLLGKGTPEVLDFFATLIGGMVTITLIELI